MRNFAMLLVLVTSCVPGGQIVVQGGGDDTDAPSVTESPDPATESPDLSGVLTSDDVCAIRAAMVVTLRASSEDWTETIADETLSFDCLVEADGTARIGFWSMPACEDGACGDGPMRFLYRSEGSQVPSYAAEVIRQDGGFVCADLGQFMVVPKG